MAIGKRAVDAKRANHPLQRPASPSPESGSAATKRMRVFADPKTRAVTDAAIRSSHLRKRIMIVEPPFTRLYHDDGSLVKFPLALGYLSGAVLKWTDWEVQAYNADFNTTAKKHRGVLYTTHIKRGMDRYLRTLKDPTAPIWAEVRSAITEFDPGVVGISSKTQNFPSAMMIARIAKEHNPDTLVVLGGPHATLSTRAALDCPDIDVAVLGEGEMTLVELLKAWENGVSLKEVAGLVYRQAGLKVFTPPRTNIPDLDELPYPAEAAPRVLRNYESYPAEAFGYVFSARGCPYSCTFCESKSIWSQKTRWRSPENVVMELKLLMERGVRYVYFDDDTFGIKPRYIKELCGLIETECTGLTWGCETTVGVVKEQSIEYMRRSRCVRINLGIESGDNGMLRKVKKGHTIEKAYAAVDLIRRKGIFVGNFFMVGFPEETEETLRNTLTAMERINSDFISLSIFTPYPGSELFQVCKELGTVDDDFDITLYNHHSPHNCFTAFIPPERFKVLVREAVSVVERSNFLAMPFHQRIIHRWLYLLRLSPKYRGRGPI